MAKMTAEDLDSMTQEELFRYIDYLEDIKEDYENLKAEIHGLSSSINYRRR